MFHVKHTITYLDFPAEQVDLVRETYTGNEAELLRYCEELLWWNQKINLVSRGVSRETLLSHIEHSLIVGASHMLVGAKRLIDAGTGGGLPGIPLAICEPGREVVLNDVVSKKILACKNIVGNLGLKNVQTMASSIKEVGIQEGDVIVTKHAFKINQLYDLVEGKPWQGLVFLKGRDEVEKELEGIREPLNIKIYDLMSGFGSNFYSGKSLVEIRRGKT